MSGAITHDVSVHLAVNGSDRRLVYLELHSDRARAWIHKRLPAAARGSCTNGLYFSCERVQPEDIAGARQQADLRGHCYASLALAMLAKGCEELAVRLSPAPRLANSKTAPGFRYRINGAFDGRIYTRGGIS